MYTGKTVSNLAIPPLERLNLSEDKSESHEHKAQMLTAENNLWAQAEWSREIPPHIFTAYVALKSWWHIDLIQG